VHVSKYKLFSCCYLSSSLFSFIIVLPFWARLQNTKSIFLDNFKINHYGNTNIDSISFTATFTLVRLYCGTVATVNSDNAGSWVGYSAISPLLDCRIHGPFFGITECCCRCRNDFHNHCIQASQHMIYIICNSNWTEWSTA